MNYENHDKLNLQHFHVFQYFFIIFFAYIKITKDLSAKYYQNNKERLPKKARERYEVFLKKKRKNNNMIVTVQKSTRT